MKVIRAIGFASGADCPHAGQYLSHADFEAYDGRAYMEFTDDPAKALQFEQAGEALLLWRTQSTKRPWRPDGRPNRPLTALTVEIVDLAKG